MPIILHIDFNSFFASVEQQANPFLRGKPIAVAGKGRYGIDSGGESKNRINVRHLHLDRTVVTTASREAKKLGIKTAMASFKAMEIAPELIMIPGDPLKYGEITKRFLNILKRHADAVEQFSTDEAFADITNASGGDYLGAAMLAQRLRADVKRECGVACSASIGIAPNKLVAKLACESMKPSGLTVVPPEKVLDFVAAQQLEDICGIGPRIARRLERLGLSSILALRSAPLHVLRKEFKSYGDFLYAAARGLGDDHVSDVDEPPKSVGHSYTFPHDLRTDDELRRHLLALCDRVAWRMRRDGLIATHVTAYARYNDMRGTGAGQQLREPFEDGLDLFKNAWSILVRDLDAQRGVRLLGVSASGILSTTMPRGIFPKQEKVHRTLVALDKLRHRYGGEVWSRASTLGTVFRARVSGWHYDHEA